MVLFAYELDRRLRRRHSSLAPIAFDPGLTSETGLVRTASRAVQWLGRTSLMKWFLKRLGVTMGSLSFADGSGKYFQSKNGSSIEARSSEMPYEEGHAVQLWTDSEQLVHLQGKEELALLL